MQIPLDLPIGLQLYTVGKEMDADPVGTLRQVAAVGYKEVELSPMSKISSKDLRKALDDFGLRESFRTLHAAGSADKLQQNIEAAKELGQEYMVVTVPWVADPSRFKSNPSEGQMGFFLAIIQGLTLDDWKWNAEQFNKIGEQVKAAGLQLGYHNHNFEFKSYGSTTGYDEFIRLTDPNLVKLELDCGWVTVAGKDPIKYLTEYPDRYRLLHIKDFKKGFTPTTTLLDKTPGAPVPNRVRSWDNRLPADLCGGTKSQDPRPVCRTRATIHGDARPRGHQSGLRLSPQFTRLRGSEICIM